MVQAQQSVIVDSPDKNIVMTLTDGENLQYSISYKGKTLVYPSPLGFELKDESTLGQNVEITNKHGEKHGIDEWEPVVRNKHKKISLEYNYNNIRLRSKDGSYFTLQVRIYNDGVAFRYIIPGLSDIKTRTITKELTGFSIPSTSYAWVGQNDSKTYTGAQESVFTKTKVTDIKKYDIDLLPMLVEVDKNNYLAITDAYLNDFPGFFIGGSNENISPSGGLNNADTPANTLLRVKLAPRPEEDEDKGAKVIFDDSKQTAWRVIMVADNPGRFIESEIVRSLNPPCKIEDTSWIKPGFSAWDHWWSGEVKMEIPVIKQYIDFAAEQGWPYMLIDWQWYGPYNTAEADITKCAPQLNMDEILEYAKAKNVKLWLWLYCTDVNRNDAYKKAFEIYEKWGIAGIKIDFMDRHDQAMTTWYRKIVKHAANHHLMVNFHGAYHPDGIDRTWPNQVTREGVMGAEYSKWSDKICPSHNITLAFTRMLAGAMDYTPGGFLNVAQGKHKGQSPTLMMNTRCAELAKFVIYESPQTVFCDHPDNVIGQPGSDFLSKVPTQWDDIKFISGYPDEYIAIAKKDNQGNWYVGVMNNENKRSIKINLSFLSSGKYTVEYWKDSPKSNVKATELKHGTTVINSQKNLEIHLASGGGYVCIIRSIISGN